jgi:hypothetical protein
MIAVSRAENRIQSIKRAYPDQLPIHVDILPCAWMKHREALEECVCRHPILAIVVLALGVPRG